MDVALVGCGGRGTGAAANALATRGPVRLVAAGELLGVEVVDHIIVAHQGYFSYREANRLECLRRR